MYYFKLSLVFCIKRIILLSKIKQLDIKHGFLLFKGLISTIDLLKIKGYVQSLTMYIYSYANYNKIILILALVTCSSCYLFSKLLLVNEQLTQIKIGKPGEIITGNNANVNIRNSQFEVLQQIVKPVPGSSWSVASPIDFFTISSDDQLIAEYSNSILYVSNIKLDSSTSYETYPGMISATFSNDNKHLYLSFTSQVVVLTLTPPVQLQTLIAREAEAADPTVTASCSSSLLDLVFLGYFDGSIKVVDIQANSTSTLSNGTQPITVLAFDDSTKTLYSTADGTTISWTYSQCPPTEMNQNGFCVCSVQRTRVNGVCVCGSKQYSDSSTLECLKCSFICEECEGGASECKSFAWPFYVLVIGCPIVFFTILLVLAIVLCKKKKKGPKKNQISQLESSVGGQYPLLK